MSENFDVYEKNGEFIVEIEFSYDITEEKVKEIADSLLQYLPDGSLVNTYFRYKDRKILTSEYFEDKRKEKLNNEVNLETNEEIKEENCILAKRQAELSKEIGMIDIKNIKSPKKSKSVKNADVIYKRIIKQESKKIELDIDENQKVVYEGQVLDIEHRELKNNSILCTFTLMCKTDAIKCKFFRKSNEKTNLDAFKDGEYYKIEASLRFDSFDKDLAAFVLAINKASKPQLRFDFEDKKRVELHMHTNMSAMNGVPTVDEIMKFCLDMGYDTIAIADDSAVQSFPYCDEYNEKEKFKIIYGLEVNVVDRYKNLVNDASTLDFDDDIVVFDIETTGLSYVNDRIIEIGAVKISNRKIVDKFLTFVNPEMHIPEESTNISGINDSMVRGAPKIETAIKDFYDFCGQSIISAHNAEFDMAFVKKALRDLGIEFEPPVLDTLSLSRLILTDIKTHPLNLVCKRLGVNLSNHHRADADATATANVLLLLFKKLEDLSINNFSELNKYSTDKLPYSDLKSSKFTLLAKNQEGIKNIYETVSYSHINGFSRVAKAELKNILEKKENLLIGSAGVDGLLFKYFLYGENIEKIKELAKIYDYIEVHPFSAAWSYVKRRDILNRANYNNINKKIIEFADTMGIPVVVSANPYFIEPEDRLFREIILNSVITQKKYKRSEDLYFMTTRELLDEFSYLGEEKAREIVVDNTIKIADEIPRLRSILDETFVPKIEGAEEKLREICYLKASKLYGENLPEIVTKRLDRELKSIIGNGYAVMYIIARKLVKKSLEDGYMVGSRGSVGSSFAATMSDITEVNPLIPHYYCKDVNCDFYDFTQYDGILSGFDLPRKNCPKCNKELVRDGHNIPFETFLGFKGEKEPDIDLNFASEYQSKAHDYIGELLGEKNVFKAGTIGKIAEKTAFGYTRAYFERINKTVSSTYINAISKSVVGIKRTTGQHPGGIMVVPDYKDINDFTPIQYPANNVESNSITTHFDYDCLSGKILKFDILGHEAPGSIKNLEDLSGFDAMNISFDDEKTMSLFSSNKELNILDTEYKETSGALGIPEFGTPFVRQMLADTNPKTFLELSKIAGLAHGTNVWLNNAQDLIRSGTATLKEAICVRDEIMTYLMSMDIEGLTAFSITERVRKGKGLTDEDVALMKEKNIPSWYIDSCNKIKYMFPMAHSVAYVMMSFRIAYYKINYPIAFYAVTFSCKSGDFPLNIVRQGKKIINEHINQIKSTFKPKKKDAETLLTLELVAEMYARGYEFLLPDLYNSHHTDFKVEQNLIRIPFAAIDGVGEVAAKSLAENAKNTKFETIEEIRKLPAVSKVFIEALKEFGALEGLPETGQYSMDMFL